MKQYLAVFLGSPNGKKGAEWGALSNEERQKREKAGMEGWGAWVERHKSSIVVMGGPLSKTKRIDGAGIHDTRNDLCAYMVMQGESYEAVARLFVEHPHFTIFPGDGVEIMEVLPVPMKN